MPAFCWYYYLRGFDLKYFSILVFSILHFLSIAQIVNAENIDHNELLNTLKHKGVFLVDVRQIEEVDDTGTIKHFNNVIIPRGVLETDLVQKLPLLETPIVFYSNRGFRSALARDTAKKMGYPNVYNYTQGIDYWISLGNDLTFFDEYKESPLFRKPIKVSERVYSAIGATTPPTAKNFGHNNNLSFIIGDDHVVVFNAGGSYLVAAALHEEIKQITPKPVKYVVLENAQGHAVLGSGYWKEHGALIVAHEKSAERLKSPMDIEFRAKRRLGARFFKTSIAQPDITFKESFDVPIKGVEVKLLYFGEAHEPDDILLWMPEDEMLISGDFTFNERMLPIQSATDILSWIEAWPNLLELNPKLIIPGHGHPTTLDVVSKHTIDYLLFLRDSVFDILENDGDLIDVLNVDNSQFYFMDLYRLLKVQNLERVFSKLEFDF